MNVNPEGLDHLAKLWTAGTVFVVIFIGVMVVALPWIRAGKR